MRRTIITIAALVAFGGFAEAHPRHHYTHHHRGHGYSHQARHLHFRGHHRHHRHALRAERQAQASEARAGQSWFGTPAPEYPQVRGQAARVRPDRIETTSIGASSAAGRVVRASWYGGGEKLSSRTASGEHFNRGGLTAAHRSLPFGTRVQVTNVATGRAVVVRINDRGPFVGGRSLDLAHGAAQAIGLHSTGAVRMVVLN
jgi:rare lipoprotein A (peptidoglycan hydrolase)